MKLPVLIAYSRCHSMYSKRDYAVKAIIKAIQDKGPEPTYHDNVMARHRHEWPALWKALDKLIEDYYEYYYE